MVDREHPFRNAELLSHDESVDYVNDPHPEEYLTSKLKRGEALEATLLRLGLNRESTLADVREAIDRVRSEISDLSLVSRYTNLLENSDLIDLIFSSRDK